MSLYGSDFFPDENFVVGGNIVRREENKIFICRFNLKIGNVSNAPFGIVEFQRMVEIDVALRLENSSDRERSVHHQLAAHFQHLRRAGKKPERAFPRTDVNHVGVEDEVEPTGESGDFYRPVSNGLGDV